MQKITFVSMILLFLFFSCEKEIQLDQLSSQIQNDQLAIDYFAAIKKSGKLNTLVNYQEYKKLRGQTDYCDTTLETFKGNKRMYELDQARCEFIDLGKKFKEKYPITKTLSNEEKKIVYGSLLKSKPLTDEELNERIKFLPVNQAYVNANK